MRYRFEIEVWTNEPINAEMVLEKAIELHAQLIGDDIQVMGHQFAIHIPQSEIGTSDSDDPWLNYVESGTKNATWTRGEISKAIQNYGPSAEFGMEVRPGLTQLVAREVVVRNEEPIGDYVENWLRKQSKGLG